MHGTRTILVVLLLVSCGVQMAGYPGPTARASGLAWPDEWVADSAFYNVWVRADQPLTAGAATRSWLWGPAPFAVANEEYVDSPTGTRLVEYLDKGRMELNNPLEDRNSPWFVTTGLLVNEMVTGQVQTGNNTFRHVAPAGIPVAGDAGSSVPTFATFAGLTGAAQNQNGRPASSRVARDGAVTPFAGQLDPKLFTFSYYDDTSRHNVPAVFRDWMLQRGPVLEGGHILQAALLDPLYVLGRPITEPYWSDVTVNGKPVTVLIQLFERRALTYNPLNPLEWRVEMANVGRAYYEWRYKGAAPGPAVASEVQREGVLVKGWNWRSGKNVNIEIDLVEGAKPLSGPVTVAVDGNGRFARLLPATPELQGALVNKAKVVTKARGDGQASASVPTGGSPLGGQVQLEGTISEVFGTPTQPNAVLRARDGAYWNLALGSSAAVLYSEGVPAAPGAIRAGIHVSLTGIGSGSKVTVSELRIVSVSRTGAALSFSLSQDGSSVAVSGTGWPGERVVSFTLARLGTGGPPPLGTARTDSRGNLSASLGLPRGNALPAGPLWLIALATDKSSQAVQVAVPIDLSAGTGEPPALYMEARSGEQAGTLGTYCWRKSCADQFGGQLIPASTLAVSAGEVLTFRSQDGPDPNRGVSPLSFKAALYDADSPQGQVSTVGGSLNFTPKAQPVITVSQPTGRPFNVQVAQPFPAGPYVLTVQVTWPDPTGGQSQANYGFYVEVR